MAKAGPPRESLTAMLRVAPRGGDRFSASLESFWGGSAKGDLLARACLVAMASGGQAPCGVQASFLARAPAELELTLAREALGAKRSRILVRRGDELLCEALFRFGPLGGRFAYQYARPERALPAPEELPSEAETGAAEGWAQYAVGPIETRRIGVQAPVKEDEPAVFQGWLHPREPLADDPRLHAAALCFLAEYRSHWAVERRLGAEFPHSEIALQDFSLWIHRAAPWDDFWLVRTLTDVGVEGRCLSRREIFTRGGELVASAAWEALVRLRTDVSA